MGNPAPADSPPAFDLAQAEKNAAVGQFFYRQFFVTPTLPNGVNLKGKTAIITGSNGGIGLETARQLLDFGISKLILAVRDESKGQTASKSLSSGRNLEDGTIEVWKLDMLSYDSITAFVERAQRLERLDIAILNAGVMKQSFEIVPGTKHEEHIQVNYLSTALLTILLIPILKAKASNETEPGHLVWLQSMGASWAKFEEKDSVPLLPAFDKPESFKFPDRYQTSKLLGQLLVTELAKRIPSSVAIINMPTPGWCYGTSMGIKEGFHIDQFIGYGVKRILGRSPAVGARNVTDAAVKSLETHGQHLQDCKIQAKAPFLYTEEGNRVAQILWEETMAELSFAGVKDIVRELSK